jgi:hypothetical protein
MQNSRLEVLGASSAFSVNKMTTEESRTGKAEDNLMYEESYSYDDSCSGRKNRNRCGSSPYYQGSGGDQSSSLDSVALMNQI